MKISKPCAMFRIVLSHKRIFFSLVLTLTLLACQKDTLTDQILQPSLSWEGISVQDDVLNIIISIDYENGELPEGIGSSALDGDQDQEFQLRIGAQELAPFRFSDNQEHTAEIRYTYADEHQVLRESKKIQRIETTENISVSNSEWIDLQRQ